jgi:hypothetical protein
MRKSNKFYFNVNNGGLELDLDGTLLSGYCRSPHSGIAIVGSDAPRRCQQFYLGWRALEDMGERWAAGQRSCAVHPSSVGS